MSSTISSRNIGFAQSSQPEMSPSNLFDGSGSSNYLHKKFKRFTSLVNEDIVNCKRCQKPISRPISETNERDSFCSECRTENSNGKPYKPKFHKATLCQSANNSHTGHSIQDIIGATNEPKNVECHSMPHYQPLVSYLFSSFVQMSIKFIDFNSFHFQLTQCIDYSFVRNSHGGSSFSQSQSAGFLGGYHRGYHETFTRSDSVLSKYSSSSFSDSNEAFGCLDLTTHNRNRQRCIGDETSDAIDLSKPRSSNSHEETNETNDSFATALYVETINQLNPLLISDERISPLSPDSVHGRSLATISYNVSLEPTVNVKSEPAVEKEISAKNIACEFLKIANQQDSNHSISKPDFHGSTFSESNKQIKIESPVASGPANDTLALARTVVVGEDGFTSKSSNSNDLPMVSLTRDGCSSTASQALFQEDRDGPGRCELCQQKFSKRSALQLHMNIHYMNPTKRKKRNTIEKQTNTSTPNSMTNNPRPFECVDCHKAFRNHGFLTKHFLSKMHVQTLENLEKLPAGTYALIASAGVSVNKLKVIDTTDYESSLASFKKLADKLKSESNTPNAKIYENYTSDTQSNDDTESKPDDDSVECDGYDSKKRRLNEDHTNTSKMNDSDEH